jgi:hypothetical protein
MEWLSLRVAGLLRHAARLVSPGRRQWAEAAAAEAGQVPAGWPRLTWLAGGLWLVAREAQVARRIVYWLGVGAVAAAAAWAIWLSWRTAPAADAESLTDRFRVGVGAAALVVLPWLGRRQGWFGPVGSSIAARLVRVAGCAAICGLGIILVRIDSRAGRNGLGSGHLRWPEQIGGLALVGVALAVPAVARARWPRAQAGALWGVAAMAGVVAWLFLPLQVLAVGYVAAILAATSRRSPVRPATLAAGVGAGLPIGLITAPLTGLQLNVLLGLLILTVPTLLGAAGAGAAAAWRLAGTENAAQLRAARVRQGLFAGATAGATSGLLLTNIMVGFVFVMVIGPLIGLAGGTLGGAFAADHPRQPRPDGLRAAGLFVLTRNT